MTEKIDSIDTNEAIDKFVTISQAEFKLRLFKRDHVNEDTGRPETEFHLLEEFDVAVGMPEYPTPTGIFVMLRRAKRPDWLPPDRDWVGPDLRDEDGKPIVVDGNNPANPIRGAFLDLGDGIGVHGTSNLPSIGTRASHGCIRVTEEQALDLYRRVPLGTPFLIY